MARRRTLRGKKLLFVSGALAGAAMLGCGDDSSSVRDSATANLLPPPDVGVMDSSAPDTGDGDGAIDASDDTSAGDGGEGGDGSTDGGGAGDASDAAEDTA